MEIPKICDCNLLPTVDSYPLATAKRRFNAFEVAPGERLRRNKLQSLEEKNIILFLEEKKKAFETTADVDYVTPAMNQSEAAAARADNLYIRFSVRGTKPQQLLLREKWQARATNLVMETRAGEGKIKKRRKKRNRCMNIDEAGERRR